MLLRSKGFFSAFASEYTPLQECTHIYRQIIKDLKSLTLRGYTISPLCRTIPFKGLLELLAEPWTK